MPKFLKKDGSKLPNGFKINVFVNEYSKLIFIRIFSFIVYDEMPELTILLVSKARKKKKKGFIICFTSKIVKGVNKNLEV